MSENPKCPYCGAASIVQRGDEVYEHRPDLAHRLFFVCVPCDARVGCHADGRAFGTLANAELRTVRMMLHVRFDQQWLHSAGRRVARKQAYARLAKAMGIHVDDCHIGQFDLEMAKRAADALGVKL